MHINLDIKPLSVNQCWQGRRFKTPKYKEYEENLLLMLPNTEFDFKDRISVEIEFGFSSTRSDIDNPLKPILDILQKKYKFNDSAIYQLKVNKLITKKKKEFININIYQL
jgi:Holliday junction resolvase RusA-like endonuclease